MFQLDYASHVPIFEQICQNVIRLASAGVLHPGDKIPPVRVLATQLGINPNTVAKSYKILESKGYIHSIVGSGSYITDSLSVDSASKLLAYEDFRKAAANARVFGISKEQMLEIVNKAFQGGNDND